MEQIEEKLAHLTRTVEDLSDVVARQDAEIQTLKRRVKLLIEREAGREAAGGDSVTFGNDRPPHY